MYGSHNERRNYISAVVLWSAAAMDEAEDWAYWDLSAVVLWSAAAMDEAEDWAYWELSRAARVAYDR